MARSLDDDAPRRIRDADELVNARHGTPTNGFHDASGGSRLAGRRPVVCHHDPGPNNTVFHSNVPIAFIDFDTAAPGDPLEDLGYMAWTWCVTSSPKAPRVTIQAGQVRVLADAYGLDAASRSRLVEAKLDRQVRNAQWWRSHLARPRPHVAADDQITDRIRWSEKEHPPTRLPTRISSQRPSTEAHLGAPCCVPGCQRHLL